MKRHLQFGPKKWDFRPPQLVPKTVPDGPADRGGPSLPTPRTKNGRAWAGMAMGLLESHEKNKF